jgi:hypothetical protein
MFSDVMGNTIMNSHLANGYAERARIEHGIREHEISLSRIDEERIQLAVRLAECKLIRRLLVTRQHTPRSGSRNLTFSYNRGVRQRRASQEQKV